MLPAPKQRRVTPESSDGKAAPGAELARFVQQRLPALSEAFAASPLMQLRVSTPSGSVLMVKAAARSSVVPSAVPADVHRGRFPHEYLPDAEPGRAYDTVSAEVVGVFRSAPDLPEAGAQVEPDRVLGYIDSLKVPVPVKAGIAGRLVGQVAEDGQPVDFGETLFIIDSGPETAAAEEPADAVPEAEALAGDIEPPRI